MEDHGQHYSQCYAEVKEFKLVHFDIRMTVGPIAFGVFNDDPLSSIQNHIPVPHVLEGIVKMDMIILN